jgi:hypothetical protein
VPTVEGLFFFGALLANATPVMDKPSISPATIRMEPKRLLRKLFRLLGLGLRTRAKHDHEQNQRHNKTHNGHSCTIPLEAIVHGLL